MDYPKNYMELIDKFAKQSECIDYIASIRWKNGFICHSCGSKDFWRSKKSIRICSNCRVQTRVLAGTLFQDTKLPLNLWFQMIWWFMGPKSGISALALKQNFGIGSYRTAWKILSKLRSCAIFPSRSLLLGDVEVDEIYLGGKNNKKLIGVAAEKRGDVTGRIRLKHLNRRDNENIHGFITENIIPGAKIISDRYKSYMSIVNKGYAHQAMKKPYSWEEVDGDDERLLPRVHHVSALLKRWYLTSVRPFLKPLEGR